MRRILKKRAAPQIAQAPDFPNERHSEEPPRLEGEVVLRRERKASIIFAKKYVAELNKGMLRLYASNKSDLPAEYLVDLAKVAVVVLTKVLQDFFQVERRILSPVDQTVFEKWKDMITKHRLYRQEICGKKQESAPEASEVSASDDLRSWDTTDVKHDLHSMLELTMDVLEKSTKMMEEMKILHNGFKATLAGFQSFLQPTPSTTTTTSTTAASMPESTAREEEDSSLYDSDEEDTEKNAKLHHSLGVTANTQQKKKAIIEKTLHVLSLPPVSPKSSALTTSSTTAETTTDAELHSPPSKPKPPLKKYRDFLPANQCVAEPIGFRSIMTMAMNKGGIPICMYEPIGLLQLMTEELKYSHLLDIAAGANSEDRMCWVAAFGLSAYSNTVARYRKPFNPVLGESFDYTDLDRKWKFHAEQVSHHPGITAGQAQGKEWIWWQTFVAEVATSKINMTSELTPELPVRLRIGSEDISWNRLKTTIEKINAVPEKRNIYHDGCMQFRSSSGCYARLIVGKNRECTGEVFDKSGRQCYKLFGTWDLGLSRCRIAGDCRERLFESKTANEANTLQYGFSKFTMALNELFDDERPSLPPTDCRFRPDMRALEQGKIDKAVQFKDSLEKLQRVREKSRSYVPLWFQREVDEFTKKELFVSNGKYWSAKKKGFRDHLDQNLFPPVYAIN